jgi:hypothetical protein
MKPHPLTLAHIKAVTLKPGMYIRDFDLRSLESQLYGFDAGLAAAGVLGDFDWFNRAFNDFLFTQTKWSCVQGWATAILERYGQSEEGFNRFLSLLEQATSKSEGCQSHATTGNGSCSAGEV